MRRLTGIVCGAALAALSSSCAGVHGTEQRIAPRHAIEMAADAAPAGVEGVFDVHVRTTGRQDGNVYLNSEDDYRDQRDLTVALTPMAMTALRAKYGEDPETFFKGKHLAVTGTAKRVKIWFTCNGMPAEKYYYQTHVVVNDVGQIRILE